MANNGPVPLPGNRGRPLEASGRTKAPGASHLAHLAHRASCLPARELTPKGGGGFKIVGGAPTSLTFYYTEEQNIN